MQVLGGCCEEELISGTIWASQSQSQSQSQSIRCEYSFEIGKQNLNLFPLSSWCHLIIGPGDISRHIASAFMHGSHDLTGGRIRRTALPKLTSTAVLHAGSVTNEPILVDTGTGRCEIAIGCPELMPPGSYKSHLHGRI